MKHVDIVIGSPEWSAWRKRNDASCDNCALLWNCYLHRHGNPYNLCRDWRPVEDVDRFDCRVLLKEEGDEQ